MPSIISQSRFKALAEEKDSIIQLEGMHKENVSKMPHLATFRKVSKVHATRIDCSVTYFTDYGIFAVRQMEPKPCRVWKEKEVSVYINGSSQFRNLVEGNDCNDLSSKRPRLAIDIQKTLMAQQKKLNRERERCTAIRKWSLLPAMYDILRSAKKGGGLIKPE